jgi:hypothetical protein
LQEKRIHKEKIEQKYDPLPYFLQEIEAVGRLRNALASKWSSNILARLRRHIQRSSSEGSHHQIIRESDIVAIHGSPYYDDGLVYYTFYVKNGKT